MLRTTLFAAARRRFFGVTAADLSQKPVLVLYLPGDVLVLKVRRTWQVRSILSLGRVLVLEVKYDRYWRTCT